MFFIPGKSQNFHRGGTNHKFVTLILVKALLP